MDMSSYGLGQGGGEGDAEVESRRPNKEGVGRPFTRLDLYG